MTQNTPPIDEMPSSEPLNPQTTSADDLNPNPSQAHTDSSAEINALQAENQTLTQEIERLKTLCARSQADADNARKRAEQEIANIRQFSNQNLIKSLLPVLDSLEKGIENCPDSTRTHEVAGPIVEGLQLTLTLFLETLEKSGVYPIQPLNQPFDPHFHEAIGTDANSDQPSKTVTQVLQTGYRLKDRAIRPALVMVAQ